MIKEKMMPSRTLLIFWQFCDHSINLINSFIVEDPFKMSYSSSSSSFPSSQFRLIPLVGFLLLMAFNVASGKLHSNMDRLYVYVAAEFVF
jgi:hypothetical protein